MNALMAVSASLLALGLVCLMARRTLIGVLVGIQVLVLGASMNFVLSGIASGGSAGARQNGHIFALVIVLAGVAALAAGFAIAVRMFYLKEKVEMDELRSLRG